MIHHYAFLFSHLAFGLIFFSFTVRTMLKLRTISVIASIFSTMYAFNVADTPLWPIIMWNAVFVSTNLWQIVRILREQRQQALSERERFFAERALKTFPVADLRSFLAAATPKTFAPDDRLIARGATLGELFLIAGGAVRIEVGAQPVAKLPAGLFLGEMSFLSRESATADAVADGPVELLSWTYESVQEWISRAPGREALIMKAFGLQMMGFLTKKSAA